MKIDILTIFPEAVIGYMSASIMQRAQDADVLDFAVTDIRDFSDNKHYNVDDTPYGGGAGMVMQVGPIHRAVEHVKAGAASSSVRTIVLSAKGERFTQRTAERLCAYDQLIFICGRYEGIDERVAQHVADEELSIGDFVLTGGELGAMIVADSVVRLLPGVLGNAQSAVYESHATSGYTEHPHYTKPPTYKGWKVPEVLLGGNHDAIHQWRKKNAGHKTTEA